MYKIPVFILSFLMAIANAQPNKTAPDKPAPVQQVPFVIKPLNVGDQVPDLVLHNILNYKSESAGLSSFRAKLLIIDFFATWCSPCVGIMPKMDSLQRKFNGQLQMIVVSDELRETLKKFLLTNESVKGIRSLPFVSNDTLLSLLFPHGIIPHEVWIDSSGTVKAITTDEEVTENNIQAMLNKSPVSLVQKTDRDLNFLKPLFIDNNGGNGSNLLYRSILTPYIDGIPSAEGSQEKGDGVNSLKNLRKWCSTNSDPVHLFISAYSMGSIGTVNKKRIILDLVDSSRYLWAPDPKDPAKIDYDFGRSRYFCYELLAPDYLSDSVFYKYMFDDLNRYFALKGSLGKKLMPCWVLVRTRKIDSLYNSKGVTDHYVMKGDTVVKILNKPLSTLLKLLNRFHDIEPILNETNYDAPLDLELNLPISRASLFDYLDMALLRKSLAKYGMDLVKADREVNMLKLTDR
jgi:thiol-disulfide isomerase/thioredoxin